MNKAMKGRVRSIIYLRPYLSITNRVTIVKMKLMPDRGSEYNRT